MLTSYSYGPIGYEMIYNMIVHQVEAMSPKSFYPINAEQFIQFILIPNIACQLLAEDKHTNLQIAYKDLIHSADVREALQQLELNYEGIKDSNIADNTTELEMNGVAEEIPRIAAAERGVASPVGETDEERINRHPVDDSTILVSSLCIRNMEKIHYLFNIELKDEH
jgi:hypothetical protein